jgi:hypothetical protein
MLSGTKPVRLFPKLLFLKIYASQMHLYSKGGMAV